MPHLKCLFHCGRQKRDNTNTIKLLHQVSIWVVVVALQLVLIGSSSFEFSGLGELAILVCFRALLVYSVLLFFCLLFVRSHVCLPYPGVSTFSGL